MLFEPIDKTHLGKYECTAKNKYEEDSITFNVLSKPINLFGEQNFETKHSRIGYETALTCPFEGFDSFEWLKDGKPIDIRALDIKIGSTSFNDTGNMK